MSLRRLKEERRLFDARKAGAHCDSCPLKHKSPIGPEPCATVKLTIVGDFPGAAEDKTGFPFSGPAGDRLTAWLAACGLSRRDVHLTNAVLCTPEKDMSGDDWKQAIAACAPRLKAELDSQQERKAICVFGDRALQAVVGRSKITPWAGGPIQSAQWNCIIVPSFHPFFATRKSAYLPVVKHFLSRAVGFAYGKIQPWQWPRLVWEPPYEEALLQLAREPALSLDIENAPNLARIRCIGVGTNNLSVSVPLPPEGTATERELHIIRDILADGRITKVLQNGQHDRYTLEGAGWTVSGPFWDTMLAHGIVAPKLPHGLTFIAACETHAPNWKSEFHEADEKELGRNSWFDKAPLSDLLPYNCKDNVQQYNLYVSLQDKLAKTHNGQALFAELNKLDSIAYKMRQHGLLVHQENRDKHRTGMSAELTRIAEEFRKLVPDEKVILGKNGQHKSLAAFFFEHLKAPVMAYSAVTGAPSLNVTTLNYYVPFFTNEGAPQIAQIARLLLKYRQLSKLLSSYIETLPVEKDGAVHPHWKPGKARTGRWAATGPALQTIPKNKKRNDGSEIPGLRNLFQARPGKWLVKADYSQLELRIMALLSGDPGLINAYATGQDVHQLTANSAFNCQANKAMRDRAKGINYSLLYGAGDDTIWSRLVIDMPDLKKEMVTHIRNTFFNLFNKVQDWQEKLLETAEREGYVEAPLSGRRQHYHDGIIVPTEIKNYPIQATAGDLANRAVITIDKLIDWNRNVLLTQIHDECMLECDDPEEGIAILKEAMEQEVELNGSRIKFPVECSVGQNWATCVSEEKWRHNK